jgi:signal transduction histidine kinase
MLAIKEPRSPMESLDARGPALRRLLRQLRHDLATPLSGAVLHLEIVTRRLREEQGAARQAMGSVDGAREAIEKAADLVAFLDQAIAIAEERPETLDLRGILADAIFTCSPHGSERGQSIQPLEPGSPAWVVGGRRALERAVEGLLALSIESAPASGRISWKLVETELEIVLSSSWPGVLGQQARPELRESTLVAWAIEAHGDRFEQEQKGADILATAGFPRARP